MGALFSSGKMFHVSNHIGLCRFPVDIHGHFFKLKNICLRREEELSLSSSILPSVFAIEQEAKSDNKQESTLTFENSVVLSTLLCVHLQTHKWKPAILRLRTNSDFLMLKCFCNKEVWKVLPKNPASFTAFSTVYSLFIITNTNFFPLPIIFSSLMYAVGVALASHMGTNNSKDCGPSFPACCISSACGDLEHNGSQSCQQRHS